MYTKSKKSIKISDKIFPIGGGFSVYYELRTRVSAFSFNFSHHWSMAQLNFSSVIFSKKIRASWSWLKGEPLGERGQMVLN